MSEKEHIYVKLAKMQGILLATKINKSGKNKHNGAKYYELEDLLPVVQLACKQMNVVSFFDFPFNNEIMNNTAELHLINLDDLEQELVFKVPFPELERLNNGMNIMQSEGAYITYLKRYLLLNTFQLTEKELIDSLEPSEDNTNEDNVTGIVVEEKPSVLDKVIARCHKDYSEEECDVKLLNKVSLQMLREKQITRQERKEIFEYLKNKQ